MAETGVLKPDARVELLDGEILDMSPIGPLHGGITKYLNQVLTASAKGRWLVAVQDPLHLDEHSEPQPDLMLLRPAEDFYRARHPRPEDVYLVIEVAESSLDYDRGRKLAAYGRAGVREAWVVNLMDAVLEVYREPHLAGYSSTSLLRAGDQAHPATFPDLTVDIEALLRR